MGCEEMLAMVEESISELTAVELSIEDKGALELVSVILEVLIVLSMIGNGVPKLVSVVPSIIDEGVPELVSVMFSIVDEGVFEPASIVRGASVAGRVGVLVVVSIEVS